MGLPVESREVAHAVREVQFKVAVNAAGGHAPSDRGATWPVGADIRSNAVRNEITVARLLPMYPCI